MEKPKRSPMFAPAKTQKARAGQASCSACGVLTQAWNKFQRA
jgi:hypothetical protein